METYRINLNNPMPFIEEGLVVALGFFDGVHTAHMQLIERVIETGRESNLKTGIITFDPYPAFVLEKNKLTTFLTPLEVKRRMFDALKLDYLFIIEFDRDIAKLPHKDFVQSFIKPLNVKKLIAGFDNRYGHKGEGNIHTIEADSDHTIEAIEIKAQMEGHEKVGSTMVRKFLDKGKVLEAARILGRPYMVEGFIIHGKGRGKAIGVPTANVALNYPYKIPKEGVYVVKIRVHNKEYDGICNIGHNPTFNYSLMLTIEVNIFDFDEDIYGEYVRISFLQRVRSEKKFASIDALLEQIGEDTKYAKEISALHEADKLV